jgi:outer membrane usher protein
VAYAALPFTAPGGNGMPLTMGMCDTHNHSIEKTPFAQATAITGLSSGLTLYGGQVSPKYHAMTAGMGKNMGGIGAVSADVTQSRSVLQNRRHATGQSWRVRYSKDVVSTRLIFPLPPTAIQPVVIMVCRTF